MKKHPGATSRFADPAKAPMSQLARLGRRLGGGLTCGFRSQWQHSPQNRPNEVKSHSIPYGMGFPPFLLGSEPIFPDWQAVFFTKRSYPAVETAPLSGADDFRGYLAVASCVSLGSCLSEVPFAVKKRGQHTSPFGKPPLSNNLTSPTRTHNYPFWVYPNGRFPFGCPSTKPEPGYRKKKNNNAHLGGGRSLASLSCMQLQKKGRSQGGRRT